MDTRVEANRSTNLKIQEQAQVSGMYIKRLVAVYMGAIAIKSGLHFTTVNELTDQLPATRPETLVAATQMLMRFGPIMGNKLLSEEDKGAIFAGMFAVAAKVPLCMARPYTYDIPPRFGSITVPLKMEYLNNAHLLVNGICRGDRLTILDDTLSTGGTAVSLVHAAQDAGASVVEMRVIVEKLTFGGRERMLALGVDVKAVLGIAIDKHGGVSVQEVMGRPITAQDMP